MSSNNINNNSNNNNNKDLSICNKLESYDKDLMAELRDGKITDEQGIYLGQQVKDLVIKSGCIN